MSHFLAVALLMISTVATLAAFGGETWRKGREPILHRINTRGWISLVCLALALVLGTRKEILDFKKDEQDKADKGTDKKQHEEEIQRADSANRDLQTRLDTTNGNLVNLQGLYQMQGRLLDSANSILSDVRGDLTQTRNDLSQQSIASVVNALAASNGKITEVAVIIPLAARASVPHGIIDVFVPEMKSQMCQELTGAEVSIQVSRNGSQALDHSSRDRDTYYDKSVPGQPKEVDALARAIAKNEVFSQSLLHDVGQRTFNGSWYVAIVKVPEKNDSAARAYAFLTSPGVVPLSIKSTFSDFTSDDDDERYNVDKAKFPDAVRSPSTYRYPSACESQMQRYYHEAFECALFIVTLDGPQHESIAFRLKARSEKISINQWEVSFTPVSVPEVTASKEFSSILPN